MIRRTRAEYMMDIPFRKSAEWPEASAHRLLIHSRYAEWRAATPALVTVTGNGHTRIDLN